MKYITPILAFLMITTATFAQDANTTTETEYKFVTAGYIRVLNEGADMKEGYTAKRIFSGATTPGGALSASFKFNVDGLYKGSELRAIIIIHYAPSDKAKKVYCMPLYNTDGTLWNNFIDDADKLTGATQKQFTIAVTRAWAWMLKK